MTSRPTIVGLTGSIACGKSTVAKMFEEHGAALVDADRLSRQLTEPGEPALARIVEQFGQEVVDQRGALDRAALAAVIFDNAAARKQLESIMHPAIAAASAVAFQEAAQRGAKVVFYEAALLIETKRHRDFDALVVVTATPEVQIARLQQRDQLDASAARQRIDSQMAAADKAALADFVIDNSRGLEYTKQQVDEVWQAINELKVS